MREPGNCAVWQKMRAVHVIGPARSSSATDLGQISPAAEVGLLETSTASVPEEDPIVQQLAADKASPISRRWANYASMHWPFQPRPAGKAELASRWRAASDWSG